MSVSERRPAFKCVWLQAQLRLGPCATASGPRRSCICSQIRTCLLPRSQTGIGIKQTKLQGANTKMDCKSINYQAFVYFYIDYNQKNT